MALSQIKVEKYRKGRSRGAIYTVPSGRCFLSHTKLAYIFCAGEPSISAAVRKGTACWSIDEETLLNMRAKGIEFIGVLCQENKDIFLTRTAHFLRPRPRPSSTRRGRPDRRYLPHQPASAGARERRVCRDAQSPARNPSTRSL
jgi:hypothetical protein